MELCSRRSRWSVSCRFFCPLLVFTLEKRAHWALAGSAGLSRMPCSDVALLSATNVRPRANSVEPRSMQTVGLSRPTLTLVDGDCEGKCQGNLCPAVYPRALHPPNNDRRNRDDFRLQRIPRWSLVAGKLDGDGGW